MNVELITVLLLKKILPILIILINMLNGGEFFYESSIVVFKVYMCNILTAVNIDFSRLKFQLSTNIWIYYRIRENMIVQYNDFSLISGLLSIFC